MRILAIEPESFHRFDHRFAAGGGQSAVSPIPLFRGTVDRLPEGLDAVVVGSDLQGVAMSGQRLIGEVLADELARLGDLGLVPPPERSGVVLAGDLFSAPTADVRGASGDVVAVWRAFARRHRWVVGVAGNHDTFGSPAELGRFRGEARTHLLDGTCVGLDGLRFGGVGGILGDARKPGRVEERQFLRALKAVLAERPDVVVLHHGPDAQRGELRGSPEVRRGLERSGPILVLCGHVYWPTPTTDLRGGAQVLNADGRVVILQRAR